jgi:hypothetical protein
VLAVHHVSEEHLGGVKPCSLPSDLDKTLLDDGHSAGLVTV